MRTPAEERYDAAVATALPATAAGLAGVYGLLAVMHPVLVGGRVGWALGITAAGTAVLLSAVAWFAHAGRVTGRFAHPLTALVVLLATVDAVLAMVLTGEPRQTTYVMLVVVGAGAALVSVRWLVATTYAVWLGWLAGAMAVGRDDRWLHYAAALVLATVLGLAIGHGRRRGLDALGQAAEVAEAAAVTDPLTGLANRRGLALLGRQIVEAARRQGDAVHCVFVEVDELGVVNDRLGTEAGDSVVVAVADVLRAVTRASDVVARWSGDQFCLVGPGAGMAPLELEKRLRERLGANLPTPPQVWRGRVHSGGAMLAPWDSGTLDTLLGKAGEEMYLRRALRRDDGPVPPIAPATRRE